MGTVHRLSRRLAKLEPITGALGSIAVISGEMPPSDTLTAWFDGSGWLDDVLSLHGLSGKFGLWFVDGPPAVLLPITPVDDVTGAANDIWLNAGSTFPHVMAIVDPGPFDLAFHFKSEVDRSEQLARVNAEIAGV